MCLCQYLRFLPFWVDFQPSSHFFCFHLPNNFHFQIIVTQIITPGMRPTQTLENTAACPSTSSNPGSIGNQTNIVPHQFDKLQIGRIWAEYLHSVTSGERKITKARVLNCTLVKNNEHFWSISPDNIGEGSKKCFPKTISLLSAEHRKHIERQKDWKSFFMFSSAALLFVDS